MWIPKAKEILSIYADGEKAPAMSAYMKNHFPFFGLQQPARKKAFTEIKSILGFPDFEEAHSLLPQLMAEPEREWHYLAIEIFISQKFEKHTDALALMTELFLTKSWWDTVDPMAVHFFGKHLLRFPEKTPTCVDEWVSSPNIWLQRLSVLYCLKYKEKTNFDMLRQTMSHLTDSNEFFVQKAMGWVLREKSKTHPDWVRETLRMLPFKPLTVREGSKYLDR
jgi:3-methyladenine DNA glycosylase AlkD